MSRLGGTFYYMGLVSNSVIYAGDARRMLQPMSHAVKRPVLISAGGKYYTKAGNGFCKFWQIARGSECFLFS